MRRLSLVLAVVLVPLVGCSTASGPDSGTGVTEQRRVSVQADVDELVAAGVTGVLATVTENGATITLAGGLADMAAGTPMPTEPVQHVRVGSVTKPFVSAVVLQLVAEGKVDLDTPVETYLPGLLRGAGIDGAAITVRQVLRHQSGLPNYTDAEGFEEFQAAATERSVTPQEIVAFALRAPADFAPGAELRYSNTNYIVAGMLVEKVTGAAFPNELNRRILEPLKLTGTYLPASGDQEIRDPHPRGYGEVDGVVTDVSRLEPSVPWTAGALIATGADLNRFFLALLAGEVVAPAELALMREGLPMGSEAGSDYGLGLMRTTLPCGVDYFGHNGGIDGFFTIAGATEDGRALTLVLTKSPDRETDVVGVLERALCP
ncbi:serine hydrolase domain-containing protein [Nocardia sp. NPDC058176]|uniref:serine hydrolase domain-containing protein n=1 Tax=Nocardia sp. NPDC058176 TaxID=3346368 RepID=UPI0036DB4FA0